MISRSTLHWHRFAAGVLLDSTLVAAAIAVAELRPRAAGWALGTARFAVVTSDDAQIIVQRSHNGEGLFFARAEADGSWVLDDLSGGETWAGMRRGEVSIHIRAELLRLNLTLVGSLP